MKKHLFAFAFVASSLVFSCGQQDQVAPVTRPQKSSARTSEVCVQPSNGIEFPGYVFYNPSDSNLGGKTVVAPTFNNPNYQYLVCLAKLDYVSGPNVYSEPWKEVYRVNESSYPIYLSSMFHYVTNNVLPITGTTYRVTYQVRTFVRSDFDCFSPEKVFSYEFTR